MLKIRELKSLNCNQKTFNHKAHVIEDIDPIDSNIHYTRLVSYSTVVCTVTAGYVLELEVHGMYSPTTTRHIKEFILQQFDLVTWERVRQDYKAGISIWILS